MHAPRSTGGRLPVASCPKRALRARRTLCLARCEIARSPRDEFSSRAQQVPAHQYVASNEMRRGGCEGGWRRNEFFCIPNTPQGSLGGRSWEKKRTQVGSEPFLKRIFRTCPNRPRTNG